MLIAIAGNRKVITESTADESADAHIAINRRQHKSGLISDATKSFQVFEVEVERKTIRRNIIAAEKPRRHSLTPQNLPKKRAKTLPRKMKKAETPQLNMDNPVVLLIS
jgi:hypothetical protein